MSRVRIDDIVLGRRYRKDLGDLQALADSIRRVGLLHPPVVVDDAGTLRLVAGQRRLAALKLNGETTEAARWVPDLDRAIAALTRLRSALQPKETATP